MGRRRPTISRLRVRRFVRNFRGPTKIRVRRKNIYYTPRREDYPTMRYIKGVTKSSSDFANSSSFWKRTVYNWTGKSFVKRIEFWYYNANVPITAVTSVLLNSYQTSHFSCCPCRLRRSRSPNVELVQVCSKTWHENFIFYLTRLKDENHRPWGPENSEIRIDNKTRKHNRLENVNLYRKVVKRIYRIFMFACYHSYLL